MSRHTENVRELCPHISFRKKHFATELFPRRDEEKALNSLVFWKWKKSRSSFISKRLFRNDISYSLFCFICLSSN